MRRSDGAFDHHFLDLCDGLGRVEALRAGLGAVHDRVAAIQFERIFQIVQTFTGCLVAAVDDPAIGMQQGRWPKIPIAIPPVRRAGGRTGRAHHAFIKTVQFLAIFDRLFPFLRRTVGLGFQPGQGRSGA